MVVQTKSTGWIWILLSSLWGAWLFAIFSAAGQPFVQAVIWGGALLVGGVTIPIFLHCFRWRELPLEVKLLAVFWVWSFLGILIAVDLGIFVRYSRQIFQFILIVLFVSFIIARSGAIKPILWAFIAVGAGLPVFHTLGLETGFTLETLQSGQRVAEANALGFRSVLGVVGVLALFPETRSILLRVILIAAGAMAIYGIVLSGARGALVALFLVLTLWPLFCFRSLFRSYWISVVFVIALAAFGYHFYEFVLHETNLGRRFEMLQRFEDGSTQTRFDLFVMGFKLAYDYFGFGAGLGQFGIASGTGYYAHNEFAELLGTTGIVGVFLYYLAYLTTWRRLRISAKRVKDRTVLYRINFAKMMLVVMVLSGLLFRPNFLGQDTMFLYALIVGVSLWSVRLQVVSALSPAVAGERARMNRSGLFEADHTNPGMPSRRLPIHRNLQSGER